MIGGKLYLIQQFLPQLPPLILWANTEVDVAAAIESNRQALAALTLTDLLPAFDELEHKGYLHWEGDRAVLTREALLRVDALLPSFFLPEHRDARYT